MNNNLSNITAELEQISAEARKDFGGLTAEQINWSLRRKVGASASVSTI